METQDQIRWTVRGIEPAVLNMLHEVSESSNMTLGEVVNAAVSEWYDALPLEEDVRRDSQVAPDGTTMAERQRFWIPGEVEFEEILTDD